MTSCNARAALAVMLALVARAAAAQEHDHDHMSQHDHAAPAQGAAASSSALYTDDDLSFLTHMIMHHQQALDMCALVPSRSLSRRER